MDDFEFKTELEEHGLAVDERDVIGGPFIPDGRYRVYDLKTHDMICDSKSYQGLIEAFESWVRNNRS